MISFKFLHFRKKVLFLRKQIFKPHRIYKKNLMKKGSKIDKKSDRQTNRCIHKNILDTNVSEVLRAIIFWGDWRKIKNYERNGVYLFLYLCINVKCIHVPIYVWYSAVLMVYKPIITHNTTIFTNTYIHRYTHNNTLIFYTGCPYEKLLKKKEF